MKFVKSWPRQRACQSKERHSELARLDFVSRNEDVVITGKPGTGKSHILKAFGLRACEQGVSMRYARCDRGSPCSPGMDQQKAALKTKRSMTASRVDEVSAPGPPGQGQALREWQQRGFRATATQQKNHARTISLDGCFRAGGPEAEVAIKLVSCAGEMLV